MKKLLHVGFIFLVVAVFFWQFLFKGLLPIPSDTIVGLYNPFRDFYAKDYPRGIPFKNFLITDPVRQQYPWRSLVVASEKKLNLPLWNPYNFAGSPLLANFQSGSFYPLNVLFFILPFNIAWSLLILLSPFLGGIFLYFYLVNLKLSKMACILGSISFAFCGFSVSWLEWGTIVHTVLWLPLILLSIDKIFSSRKNFSLWNLILIFSLSASLFAGHLQTFFYTFIISAFYLLFHFLSRKDNRKKIYFLGSILIFFVITSVQWIPTLQFISLSARSADVLNWTTSGWFLPWQNLIQFFSPDFFGNPATLNYFGVWNYGEFIGYVGIIPLTFAFFALFFRRDRRILFFGSAFFLSLIFALPTFIAKIPFQLNIPFISTSQPTRLLFIVDFSLSVLAAFGFDYFLKSKKGFIYSLGFVSLIFVMLWSYVLFIKKGLTVVNLSIAKQNMILPTIILVLFVTITFVYFLAEHRRNRPIFLKIFSCLIILLISFDLLRFGLKFDSFAVENYLFPSTSATEFLQRNTGDFRIMTTDSAILPPNFSAVYRIQSVDGYDPLYLLSYGELMAAFQREEPNINSPFGFNRIITPHNYSSPFINLLGVKYVLSLTDIKSDALIKVFQEGKTQIYENKNVLPRAFFVKQVISIDNKQKEIDALFENAELLGETAIVEEMGQSKNNFAVGKVKVVDYESNSVRIETDNTGDGFLVLTDSFYPTWKAKVDGNNVLVYLADFNFRGVFVPKGKHIVEFYDNLF